MTLLELFRFLVPYFDTVPNEDVLAALALAEAYRPACLSTEQQDTAQVWYAAWLLYQRELQLAATGGGTGAPVMPLGVTAEQEGDLRRSYGWDGAGNGGSASDPFGYHAQWKRLAAMCSGGITVGNAWRTCCAGLIR